LVDSMDEVFDPAIHRPFVEGVPYRGKYETGLYPGGKNEIPKDHLEAGKRVAATILPLDVTGKPDRKGGRITAIIKGHSNCRMYFEALETTLLLRDWSSRLDPCFNIINAAVGGQQLPEIVQLQGRVWDLAKNLLERPGFSAQQVQVLFLHTTYHGAVNKDRMPPGEFPERMKRMQHDLLTVLEHCALIYPQLKIAYLTCDGFRYFTGFEPHVWREAFGFKWLIESQIKGRAGTEFEGKKRRIPWLQWGPYIWDSTWHASYFTDGVHPAPKARAIFIERYWEHLRGDPVTKTWLWNR